MVLRMLSMFLVRASAVMPAPSTRCASRAASAPAVASSFSRQQRLYFLPLPQGQGSFRPGLAIAVLDSTERGGALVSSAATGCEILRHEAGGGPHPAGGGAEEGLRDLWGRPPLVRLPAQAARGPGRAG